MWTDTVESTTYQHAVDALLALCGAGHARAVAELPLELPGGVRPGDIAALGTSGTTAWLDGGHESKQLIALSTVGEVSWTDGTLSFSLGDGHVDLVLPPFDALDAALEVLATRMPTTRLFGYLGYDLGASIEDFVDVPAADQDLPGYWFALVDVWAEGTKRADGSVAWCVRGADDKLAEVAATLMRQVVTAESRDEDAVEQQAKPEVRSQPDEPGYEAAVARTVLRIHAGDFFEANICRRLEVPWVGPPRQLYDRMRAASPGSHGAFLQSPDWTILSVSPEVFLRVRGSEVVTQPIKGTRPRHGDAATDAAHVADLLASEKDGAELAMIVDLARNDLGRVCRPGSVQVTEHRAHLALPTVHHTYSSVRGELEDGTATGGLLRASFPPGSITGAPKIEAIRAAYAEEPRRRGVAMGSIGWIDPSGDLELSVAIRTATVAGGIATYHAGCGIVADSVPSDELDETKAKALPFVRAVSGD
ncbi:MAG: aminodeoxychorismate/anthranilate synthase component I [Acidobacteria bacterium]|nr:aminodeoxychorismate/anthranilate synthase component I [Acidobacteriota bacterium]